MTNNRVDALVIFGATGDLAKLETFPALVGLVDRGVLDVPIIGVARRERDVEQFREYAIASLQHNGIDPDSDAAKKMLGLLDYVRGDLTDDATYQKLSDKLGTRERILFYLEVPAQLFGLITKGIAKVGLARTSRIMVEKPFGTDLRSARELNATLHEVFDEGAIFRVDHWLGLEPVENLFCVRFSNSTLEPLLNRDFVESMQITMAEKFGVSDRGRFYDRTGAIRDVLQNHLLQLLVSVLADPPSHGIYGWQDEKSRAMKALRTLTPEDAVRGQYEGYRDVPGVAPHSTVETFAAVRLFADSWRWADVPIAIRAGKCLPVTATEVTIRFRRPPQNVCGLEAFHSMNTLRFRVRPEAAVTLTLAGKKPGIGIQPQAQDLTFARQHETGLRPYDRLIGAAIEGDQWLFARQDTVEEAWRIVDPILDDVVPLHFYPPGSWGPREADRVLPDGDSWYDPQP